MDFSPGGKFVVISVCFYCKNLVLVLKFIRWSHFFTVWRKGIRKLIIYAIDVENGVDDVDDGGRRLKIAFHSPERGDEKGAKFNSLGPLFVFCSEFFLMKF